MLQQTVGLINNGATSPHPSQQERSHVGRQGQITANQLSTDNDFAFPDSNDTNHRSQLTPGVFDFLYERSAVDEPVDHHRFIDGKMNPHPDVLKAFDMQRTVKHKIDDCSIVMTCTSHIVVTM